MKSIEYIYEDGLHRWAVVRNGDVRQECGATSFEFLVVNGRHALLCDPGGGDGFPAVFAAISTRLDPRQIGAIFAPSPDPDVATSLGMWLDVNPDMKCYASWLWRDFLPAIDSDGHAFVNIPDEGAEILLGNLSLRAVPAHALDGPGNFQLYDARAGILFSGNVGAATFPAGSGRLFVADFDEHVRHAGRFYRSHTASKEAVLDWCERVSRMRIDMLCPQRGAIYRGEDVMRFINWFAEQEAGASCREVS